MTAAGDGNLAIGDIRVLADSLHNAAIIDDLGSLHAALTVTNPLPGRGGAAAETLEQALRRGFVAREALTRAVTLADCETLALGTPGTRVARAAAWADVHPSYPCYSAPGMITVVIVPWLPPQRPYPSAELRQLVQSHLDRRTQLGTRIVVTGPTYRAVAIHALVRALPGAHVSAVRERIGVTLAAFFDPLHGGSDGTGWPFGRAVFRSEVLQVLADTAGVDHVMSLQIVLDGGEESCGDACLAPTELVATAHHSIEVVQ